MTFIPAKLLRFISLPICSVLPSLQDRVPEGRSRVPSHLLHTVRVAAKVPSAIPQIMLMPWPGESRKLREGSTHPGP